MQYSIYPLFSIYSLLLPHILSPSYRHPKSKQCYLSQCTQLYRFSEYFSRCTYTNFQIRANLQNMNIHYILCLSLIIHSHQPYKSFLTIRNSEQRQLEKSAFIQYVIIFPIYSKLHHISNTSFQKLQIYCDKLRSMQILAYFKYPLACLLGCLLFRNQ